MEQTKTPSFRLYNTSIIENKRDELEEKYERSYSTLQSIINGLSEKEAHDALNNAVAKDKAHEEAISLGLLTSIIINPSHAAKSYRDLTLISRDGLGLVQVCLNQLVVERWLRLTDCVRSQIIWLLRELMRTGVTGVDNLCWNLMRYMVGGDVSPRNLFLVESLLDIFIENRVWLEKFPLIIASVVYTYLRLVEDHMSSTLASLQKKEVNFLISLIRDRFNDCLIIGRDFIRLLQNVARIPEFDILWRDLLHNPKTFSSTFTGVVSILQTRTSRRFLQSRLTPDMEQKIVFLTSNVRFGNHKRYQDWFQRQYLSTPESQSLRCDLIRFIVGVIHPTNELLSSDIIPRWAVIGWLLTTSTSSVATANSKLALFYDWLFFDPEKDNIMNIEPAILVIHNSLRSHPAVTATLLDFLCRIIPNFYPPFAEKVRNGIYTSLRQILEKRVLPSIYPLFANPKLDRDLKNLIHDSFPEFCFPPPMEGGRIDDVREEDIMDCGPPDLENHNCTQQEAVFSDEEPDASEDFKQDIPLVKLKELNKVNKKPPAKKKRLEIKKEEIEDLDVAKNLEGELKLAVESLHLEKDNEIKCEAMEKVVQLVIQDEDDESEVLPNLAKCLCDILQSMFEIKVFPETVSLETLEDSIGKPLFVLMRNLVELTAMSDQRRHPLSALLVEMYTIQNRIGYLLLFYIQASTAAEEIENTKNSSRNDKMLTYKEFSHNLEKNLEDCIMDDLKLCQEDDVQLLCWLAPGIYNEFPNIAIGDANLLHLVVSSVDARQLQELVCMVVQGRLIMLQEDSLQNILTCSLMWETFEQICLWQLVTAHSMSIDSILPVLTKLDFASHAEALTAILLMLQQEKPTAELVKQVLSRDVGPHCDLFVVSVLLSWCREHEERLAELIGALLSSRCPAGTAAASPSKRKRAGTRATAAPTAERILGHLDRLRPGTKLLYKTDAMQKALQLAQSACTESQKSQFSNLFALLEIEESSRGKGGGRGRRPGNTTSNKRSSVKEYISDSSEDSSQEEESGRKISRIIKSKQSKKRRKVVGSDSE